MPPPADSAKQQDPTTGTVTEVYWDGAIETKSADGNYSIADPPRDGGAQIDPATGIATEVRPDGRVTTRASDGTPINISPPPPETPILGAVPNPTGTSLAGVTGYSPFAGGPFDIGACMVAASSGGSSPGSALTSCADQAVAWDDAQAAAATPAIPVTPSHCPARGLMGDEEDLLANAPVGLPGVWYEVQIFWGQLNFC